jgi:maltose-binding protein MalE
MTRRRDCVSLLLAVLFAVAGCAAKKSGEAGKSLVLWTQMDPEERARFVENLEAFKQSHPGVDIRFVPYDTENLHTQYQSAAAAGGGPQLIFGPSDQVGPLSLTKLIKPLDTTMPAGFFDRFVPQALDTLDGHIYAAPDQVGNHLVLCFNRKLVPQPPETAAEFVAIAKRHTRPAQGTYGFAMNLTEPYWLAPFFNGFGGWVMDAERRPTLDSPAMVRALAFLRDLKTKQGIMPKESDYQITETLFKEGKAAMIVNGPWSWSGYRKAGIDVGVAPIFRLPNGEWAKPMTASKGYSINANIEDEDLPLAIEFITYMTSPAAELRRAAELGILPSHEDAYSDSTLAHDATLQASRHAYDLGRRMPVVPEMRVLWDVMRTGMQEVMNGSKTPEQAAKDMQSAAVEQIRGMKS